MRGAAAGTVLLLLGALLINAAHAGAAARRLRCHWHAATGTAAPTCHLAHFGSQVPEYL